MEKWRFGDPETKADLWTRGKEALPVYNEAQAGAGAAPVYAEKYDGPSPEVKIGGGSLSSNGEATAGKAERVPSTFTADGKTSEQIIAEAKAKAEAQKKDKKGSWKNTFKRATEYAMMGN